MIVCVCKSVSDRKIRTAIADGVDSFDELQFELGVALCCGKCEESVRDVMAQSGVCASRCGVDTTIIIKPCRSRSTNARLPEAFPHALLCRRPPGRAFCVLFTFAQLAPPQASLRSQPRHPRIGRKDGIADRFCDHSVYLPADFPNMTLFSLMCCTGLADSFISDRN